MISVCDILYDIMPFARFSQPLIWLVDFAYSVGVEPVAPLKARQK